MGRKKLISKEKRDELRDRVAAGENRTKLAEEFGVSRNTIYRIWREKQRDTPSPHSTSPIIWAAIEAALTELMDLTHHRKAEIRFAAIDRILEYSEKFDLSKHSHIPHDKRELGDDTKDLPATGEVYFSRIPSGEIKIGCSCNLAKRLRALTSSTNIAHNYVFSIQTSYKNMYKLENDLHKMFAEKRIANFQLGTEYFRLGDGDIEMIMYMESIAQDNVNSVGNRTQPKLPLIT